MSIESALKKYRAKYIKIGISKELFMRKEFKKKSVRRRDEIARAVYRESIKSDQNWFIKDATASIFVDIWSFFAFLKDLNDLEAM